MSKSEATALKIIATNARARHLYHIRETFEAGIVLVGSEVKALREGRVQLREAYVEPRHGELFLSNCHIGAYSHTGYTSHEAMRSRKLLLKKREIKKITGVLTLKGLTMVALKMYLKKGKVKLELALAEGKKLHDKRESSKRKDAEREMAAAMKRSRE